MYIPFLDSEPFDNLIEGGYINVDVPEESKLVVKINNNHPSASSPSDGEKQLILQWINEGAVPN